MRDGLVSKEELEEILAEQRDTRQQRISGRRLGEILIQRGTVTPTQVAKLVAEQYELPFVDFDVADIDLRAAAVLTEEDARRFSAVPINRTGDGSFLLAIADPSTVLFSDELRKLLGSVPRFAVVGPDAIERAIDVAYRQPAPASPVQVVGNGTADDLLVRPSDEDQVGRAEFDPLSQPDRLTQPWPPLGALLVRDGLLAEDDLDAALAQQRLAPSLRLGEILVGKGLVTRADVSRLVAEQYELPFFELARIEVDPSVARLLPEELAWRLPAVPIARHEDDSLDVAIADPANAVYSDDIQQALGVPLTFVVASPDEIETVLEAAYAESEPPEVESPAAAAESALEAESLPEAKPVPEATAEQAPGAEPPIAELFGAPNDEATYPDPTDDAPLDDSSSWQSRLGLVEDIAESAEESLEYDQAVDLQGQSEEEPARAESAPSEPESDAAAFEAFELAYFPAPEGTFEPANEDEVLPPEIVRDPPPPLTVVENPTPHATEVEAELTEPSEAEDEGGEIAHAVETALDAGASTIHFSPRGQAFEVRARIGGVIQEVGEASADERTSLVEMLESSGKARAHDVETKRGRKTTLSVGEQPLVPRSLTELGLDPDSENVLREALDRPSGAILVCGPAGSGTTTTLYAALEELASADRVAATIENPVERLVQGVDQVDVATTGGTFAGGLRALLRTDSDVLLIGELADQETALMAMQAALDGRHVLTSLDASSAATAIRKLTDLGVDPGLAGSALNCVVAQRLVRSLCADCRETYYASESELEALEQPEKGGPRLLARGSGCGACDGTGFRGYVVLFEVLPLAEDVRKKVAAGASAKKIQRAGVAAGMRTLRDAGIRLCLEGATTIAELERALELEG